MLTKTHSLTVCMNSLHIEISPDVAIRIRDISGLASGMYVMRVALNDGKVFEVKIVKDNFFYWIFNLRLENYSYFCSQDEWLLNDVASWRSFGSHFFVNG